MYLKTILWFRHVPPLVLIRGSVAVMYEKIIILLKHMYLKLNAHYSAAIL